MPTLEEAHDERDEADEGSGRCQVVENGGKTKRRGSLSELWEKSDVERPTEVDGRNEAHGSEGRRVASALDGVKIEQLRRFCFCFVLVCFIECSNNSYMPIIVANTCTR